VVVEKNARETDRFFNNPLYRFLKISSEIQKGGISIRLSKTDLIVKPDYLRIFYQISQLNTPPSIFFSSLYLNSLSFHFFSVIFNRTTINTKISL
jgi:hypothetical protein